jgi:fructose-1-phosphate kinase PfkB-like protein
MKVAVTGPICKDIIVINNDVVREGVGGSTYYEAKVLKMLGVDVKVFGTYAKKDDELIQKSFEGINLESIYVEATITHELFYKKENPDVRETKVPEYGPNAFPVDNKLLDELKNFDYIFLGPLYYENLPFEFFEKMKGSNLVINNFGLFTYFENGEPVRRNPENLSRIAPFLKYLFLDEAEARFAAQKESIEESAKHFLELGTETVAITRGSKGSVVFTKDKKYTIPAYPPEKLVDPTGAGDTYLAAFIYATTLFDDIQKQGEFAAMAATMAIENAGAFEGSFEEIMRRLKSFQNT